MSKLPSLPIESRHTWDYFYPGLFLPSLFLHCLSHGCKESTPTPQAYERLTAEERLFLPLQHSRAGGKWTAVNFSAASLNQLPHAALLPGPQAAARLLLAITAACTSPITGDISQPIVFPSQQCCPKGPDSRCLPLTPQGSLPPGRQ